MKAHCKGKGWHGAETKKPKNLIALSVNLVLTLAPLYTEVYHALPYEVFMVFFFLPYMVYLMWAQDVRFGKKTKKWEKLQNKKGPESPTS